MLPPLLPVALVIGHTKSADRLKKKDILCVDPKRIAISGKIHAFMFDKTGTLTKQGLDFLGVHRCQSSTFEPEQTAYVPSTATPQDMLTWSLATCHAVTTMRKTDADGGEIRELVGNQVEVQMFKGCGWNLIEKQGAAPVVSSPHTSEELTIERRFEFDHHSMTMSVIVRDTKGGVHVFCKGAPDKVTVILSLATTAAAHCTDSSMSSATNNKLTGIWW